MNQLFVFLTSPEFHLMFTAMAFMGVLNAFLLGNRSMSFRLGTAAMVMFVWCETITLCLGYYIEPGYGFYSVLADAYEEVVPPIIPLAVLLLGWCICIAFTIASQVTAPKEQAVRPSLPMRRSGALH